MRKQPFDINLYKLGSEDPDTRFDMDIENIEAFEDNLRAKEIQESYDTFSWKRENSPAELHMELAELASIFEDREAGSGETPIIRFPFSTRKYG